MKAISSQHTTIATSRKVASEIMSATQIEIPGIPAPEPKELAITPMSLMQMALETGKAEQLQILQEMYFKDLARKAEEAFNLAMNAAQSEVTRVIPDAYNQETKSKWATYPALDKMLRPIYIKHGFSLSFDSGESPADTVTAFCYLSHREGHTRKYQSPPVPLPTKGAKGGAVMTSTHGTGAAMSYAKRYLLCYIFNIPVGDEDTDGNAPQQKSSFTIDDYDELQDRVTHFAKLNDFPEMEEHWRNSRKWAIAKKDQKAVDAIDAAKNARKAELMKARNGQ